MENETQLRELRRLGCEYSQGYHHSRPLPAEDLGRWIGLEPEPTPPPAPETTGSSMSLGERLSVLVGERTPGDDPAPPPPPPPAPLASAPPPPAPVEPGAERSPLLFDQDSALG